MRFSYIPLPSISGITVLPSSRRTRAKEPQARPRRRETAVSDRFSLSALREADILSSLRVKDPISLSSKKENEREQVVENGRSAHVVLFHYYAEQQNYDHSADRGLIGIQQRHIQKKIKKVIYKISKGDCFFQSSALSRSGSDRFMVVRPHKNDHQIFVSCITDVLVLQWNSELFGLKF